jgi:hypothetical protein
MHLFVLLVCADGSCAFQLAFFVLLLCRPLIFFTYKDETGDNKPYLGEDKLPPGTKHRSVCGVLSDVADFIFQLKDFSITP